jgi:hypothetical protein
MICITLTVTEILAGANVGIARRIKSLFAEYDHYKHADKSDWAMDIDGALAEQAFAKYRGVYWNCSNGTFKAPDVEKYQTRSTSHRNGHLIVRPNDEGNEVFVLIITKAPKFYIRGWMTTAEAKQDKYWHDDSWWVPQTDVHDIASLPDGELHDSQDWTERTAATRTA